MGRKYWKKKGSYRCEECGEEFRLKMAKITHKCKGKEGVKRRK